MEPFEEKLRDYFDQVQPDEEFLERLKALEDSPKAEPSRRFRRWLTPAAAAVAAVVALGSGWAYLRATLPGNPPQAPAPAAEAPAPERESAPQSAAPAPKTPAAPVKSEAPPSQTPEAGTSGDRKAAEPRTQAEDTAPAAEPRDSAKDAPPADSEPESAAGQPGAEEPPQALPDESPQAPAVDPPPPPAEDTPPPAEDIPAVSPEPRAEDDPPPEEEPNDAPPELPAVSAVYRLEGGQETLVLTNLSTGETAGVDVTGILPEKLPAGPVEYELGAAAASSASESPPGVYSGTARAFGCQIVYFLTGYRESADASVLVVQSE